MAAFNASGILLCLIFSNPIISIHDTPTTIRPQQRIFKNSPAEKLPIVDPKVELKIPTNECLASMGLIANGQPQSQCQAALLGLVPLVTSPPANPAYKLPIAIPTDWAVVVGV